MKLKDLVKGTKVTDNKIAHKEVPIENWMQCLIIREILI